MVIIAVLAVFSLAFYLLRRRIGMTLLAIVAGLTVYSLFGANVTEWLCQTFSWLDAGLTSLAIYAVLAAVLPLIIYLRSTRAGLYGVLRIAEALLLGLVLTTLLASRVGLFVALDDLSAQIVSAVTTVEGALIAIAVVCAYLDILFLKNHDE